MIQIIKLTEAMAVLEKKAEDMVNLANNINSTTADLEAKAIITGVHNCISIAEQFHEISETLCTTIHDILPQRFHAIQCDCQWLTVTSWACIKPTAQRRFLSGLERELDRVPIKLQSTYTVTVFVHVSLFPQSLIHMLSNQLILYTYRPS